MAQRTFEGMEDLSAQEASDVRTAVGWSNTQQYAKAIKTFSALHEKHPRNMVVGHELAFVLLLSEDHGGVIKLLEKMRSHGSLPAETAVLLGSAYDNGGDADAALRVFEDTIKQNPKYGRLYVNAGITLMRIGRIEKALAMFESGIAADPNHASNYYHAACIFEHTHVPLWAVIYGEIFRILEPNSDRSQEVSALLMRVYRDAVTVTQDEEGESVSVELVKEDLVVTPEEVERGEVMDFAHSVEIALGGGLAMCLNNGELRVGDMSRVRTVFLSMWSKSNSGLTAKWKDYPLFVWFQEVESAGHGEAYAMWLYSQAEGAGVEVQAWVNANQVLVEEFSKWFASHTIKLDKHPTVRTAL